jgi:hypothetical protein
MNLQIIIRKPISFLKGVVGSEDTKRTFGDCVGSCPELG